MKKLLSIALTLMLFCSTLIGLNVYADDGSVAQQKFAVDRPAIIEYARANCTEYEAQLVEISLKLFHDRAYFGEFDGYNIYYVNTFVQLPAYYSESIGGYEFTVSHMEQISPLGVFAVKGDSVYTFKDAYDKGVITNIDAIAKIIAASGLIKVVNLDSQEELPSTGSVTTTTDDSVAQQKFAVDRPAIVEYARANCTEYEAQLAEANLKLLHDRAYFGEFDGYNIYYVSTFGQHQMYYSESIGGYEFTVSHMERISPLGVFAVKGDSVYTFKDAYDKGVITNIDAIAKIIAASGLIKVVNLDSQEELPSTGSVPTTTTATEPIETYHIVAGDPGLCNGVTWDPSSEANKMTKIDDDTYEIIYEGVAAGTYDFKITTNGKWDEGDYNLVGDAKFGGPNAEIIVAADNSTVKIMFDGTKAIVYINGNLYTVPASTQPTPSVAQPTTTSTKPVVTKPPVKVKKNNPISVTVKNKTIKSKSLKKKKAVVKAITVKKAQGKVTFSKISGNKKFTLNKSTGKIIIPKGTKKGNYGIKIKVTAKGNSKYKSKTVIKKITIKIK